METLVHADVFFFVTTIVVVLVGAAAVILLVYLTLILRDIRAVMKRAKCEIQDLMDDARRFREHVMENGITLGQIISFFRIKSQKRSKQKNK
ncbi:MAG: hypothetical protein AAB495_04115 [Patescibacteria group bacterium]